MQKVDLYSPIVHDRVEKPPLTIRVGVYSTNAMVEGGTPGSSLQPEVYVLLSALPQDLQQRVKTAVQAIISGM